MAGIEQALRLAGDRETAARGNPSDRKNYAERLSRALAQLFADRLRPDFPGILPAADGSGQESRARTAHGYKRLDVNYSTPELGLGLGVSIKTVNFPDPRSARYTKNFTRIDNELRAEALDYHHRQPYAVMVAVVFLPSEACEDARAAGPEALSSFAHAITVFRRRSGRERPSDPPELFEAVFLALYETSDERFGNVLAVEVREKVRRRGPPRLGVLDFDGLAREIVRVYDRRNLPADEWDEDGEEGAAPAR